MKQPEKGIKLTESFEENKRKSVNAKIFSRFRLFMYEADWKGLMRFQISYVILSKGLTLTKAIYESIS